MTHLPNLASATGFTAEPARMPELTYIQRLGGRLPEVGTRRPPIHRQVDGPLRRPPGYSRFSGLPATHLAHALAKQLLDLSRIVPDTQSATQAPPPHTTSEWMLRCQARAKEVSFAASSHLWHHAMDQNATTSWKHPGCPGSRLWRCLLRGTAFDCSFYKNCETN